MVMVLLDVIEFKSCASLKYFSSFQLIKTQKLQVKVLDVKNGYASVKKADGTVGKCPSYFLTMSDIPGTNFAEQIQ